MPRIMKKKAKVRYSSLGLQLPHTSRTPPWLRRSPMAAGGSATKMNTQIRDSNQFALMYSEGRF